MTSKMITRRSATADISYVRDMLTLPCPVNTQRQSSPVSTSRVDGPVNSASGDGRVGMETSYPSTRAVNSGHQPG